MLLLFASAVTGYKAAYEWNNPQLANWCLCAFSIFWAGILIYSLRVCPKDELSESIEDQAYTPDNVNSN